MAAAAGAGVGATLEAVEDVAVLAVAVGTTLAVGVDAEVVGAVEAAEEVGAAANATTIVVDAAAAATSRSFGDVHRSSAHGVITPCAE